MLIPFLNQRFAKKQDSKMGIVRLINSNNFQIVIILLTNIVVV